MKIIFRTLSGRSVGSHREPRGTEPTAQLGGQIVLPYALLDSVRERGLSVSVAQMRLILKLSVIIIINDGLCISSMQKRMLFAGFTAVKKTIIQNWFTPHMCREAYWIRSLLQIVSCECTTARVGGARPSTIEAWQCFLLNIRDYLKE